MSDPVKMFLDSDTPQDVKDLILGAAESVVARHLEICTKESCSQCSDILTVLDIRDRQRARRVLKEQKESPPNAAPSTTEATP